MGIRYRIYPEEHLGTASASGRLKGVDIERMARLILYDPAWRTGFNMLWDCREITELVLDIEEVDGIARTIHAFCPQQGQAKAAIITLRETDYISARLIALWSRMPCCDIQVFQCSDAATDWLGVPGEVI
jgi:hypothetical protein